MLNHFHRIPERVGRTDGQTDRRTDRIAIARMQCANARKKIDQELPNLLSEIRCHVLRTTMYSPLSFKPVTIYTDVKVTVVCISI